MFVIIAVLGFMGLLGPVLAAPTDYDQQSVNLTVYYESLCPDSIHFITTQLYPAWTTFKEGVHVDFKPFGKASYTANGSSWDFRCQHGPTECLGNIEQACLLNLIDKQEEIIPLIYCIMSKPNPALDFAKCTSGLDANTLERLSKCIESDEGPNLLHDIGVETHALQPQATFIPHVLFNQEFHNDEINAYLTDLKTLLCTKYLPESQLC